MPNDPKANPFPARFASTLVPKIGQTASYLEGDDGYFQSGVMSPSPRFIQEGETVTDNLTGLIWLLDANVFNSTCFWHIAVERCRGLNVGGCTEWRLPNVREQLSLIDYGQVFPALPPGHPFVNVPKGYYWSSTTYAGDTNAAWIVGIEQGVLAGNAKMSGLRYAWPVRGGQ
jgi:hypothetical protein